MARSASENRDSIFENLLSFFRLDIQTCVLIGDFLWGDPSSVWCHLRTGLYHPSEGAT